MKKSKKITTAAFLAGATTLAVSLPVLSENRSFDLEKNRSYLTELYGDFIDTAEELESEFKV